MFLWNLDWKRANLGKKAGILRGEAHVDVWKKSSFLLLNMIVWNVQNTVQMSIFIETLTCSDELR